MRAARGALALLLGLAFGWGLVKGAGAVLFETDPRALLPPCFEVGSPYHHRFRPSCSGKLATPAGPVQIETNEDGLREAPRRHVLAHPLRVAVLGDSFVEGWWASNEQALSSLLTRELPAAYFLNAGLRSTGPRLQASRLSEVLRAYRPAGVLWLLNDTDALDDRYACAAAIDPAAPAEKLELGTPEFRIDGWREKAVALLGESVPGARLRRRFYERNWRGLLGDESARRCGCRGVEEVKRVAREAGVPLLVFYLTSEAIRPLAQYVSAEPLREELQACLARAGIPFRPAGPPASMSPAEVEKYFLWDGDFHFNPEGTAMLAAQLAPAVKGWLASLRTRPKEARPRGSR